MSHHERHRDRITDEAALWFARAQDPDFSAADKKALAGWLAGSAEHVREYLALAALAGDIGDASETRSVDELVKFARETGDGANVLPISRAGVVDQQDIRRDLDKGDGSRSPLPAGNGESRLPAVRWPRRLWLVAASIVLAIATGAALYIQNIGPEVYVTALGEQRSVRLNDGSIVTLNAKSRIEVAFTAADRHVRLLSGEVLFEVEKDPSRPFQVYAQGTVIRAIGTSFNVRYRGEDTTVTVVEGTVEVDSLARALSRNGAGARLDVPAGTAEAESVQQGKIQPVRVTVGQQGRVESESDKVAVVDADIRKATAWRQRRLVFDAWPLSKVVAEFNLYNDRPIVISNRELAARRISGAFDADDRESFSLFLEEASLASTERKKDGTIILRFPQESR